MPIVEIGRLKEGTYSDPKTGWAAYPFLAGFDGGADYRGTHIVAIYPGQLRGNHYHNKTSELLFLFTGQGIFYWEEEGQVRQHPVTGPTLIKIPPTIRHAFRNSGDSTVHLLALRDGKFDPQDPDIVRSELVAP
jgi:dTDP-4-dehydrorhamnose 3,5-epimerase-like enzyme